MVTHTSTCASPAQPGLTSEWFVSSHSFQLKSSIAACQLLLLNQCGSILSCGSQSILLFRRASITPPSAPPSDFLLSVFSLYPWFASYLPWSQRFFCETVKKSSGNSGTESHFHAVDSCQICHLSNYTINQSLGCYPNSSNQE